MPPIFASLVTPMTAEDGAAITGPLATETEIDFDAAELPRLSVAFNVIVSGASVPSVSLNVPSAAVTWPRVPEMVRFRPGPDTLAPPPLLADSTPCVSDSVTENVSPAVVPVSDRLTPAIVSGLATPTVTKAGAAITGRPFIVNPIEPGLATLPNPSVALSAIVSVPGLVSWSVSVPRAALT
jgi:hypothetical protein